MINRSPHQSRQFRDRARGGTSKEKETAPTGATATDIENDDKMTDYFYSWNNM